MLSLSCEKQTFIVKGLPPTEKQISISIPISNANTNANANANAKNDNLEDLDEYSLNYNNFNPGKMSPPDLWKNRLQNRLKNHFSFNALNE